MADTTGTIAVLRGRIELLEELIETCESYIGVSGGRDVRLMLSVLKQRLALESEKYNELKKNDTIRSNL